MTPPRVFAVDWSGAKQSAHRTIWLAEVVDGALVRLENGRGRKAVVEHLIEEAEADPHLVVGFDFAFSFPSWFLEELGVDDAPEAWMRVAEEGEAWLAGCEPPFWGRPGRRRPEMPAHFRRTELDAQAITHSQPKSVFQVGGAGAVGTGSLRGMPWLARLADAGFRVWPFHPPALPDRPLALEIYPRLLTGAVVKSDHDARLAYLEGAFPEIRGPLRETAAGSEDALDAAVSAVVMARHVDRIVALEMPEDPRARREGLIWWPDSGAEGEPGCPFCELDGTRRLAESEHGVAIPDAFPVTEGHALVLPRAHVRSVFELTPEAQEDLWRLVRRVRGRLLAEDSIEGFRLHDRANSSRAPTSPRSASRNAPT